MIEMRRMEERDIATVVGFLSGTDEAFMHQWGGGRWYTFPVTEWQMVLQYQGRRDNTRYFVICDGDELVGSAELDFIDWDKKECSVCRFLVASEKRAKGYGTQALKALARIAFNEMHMARVTLTVFDFNVAAIACYKKAGFVEVDRETRDNGWVALKMEICNPGK